MTVESVTLSLVARQCPKFINRKGIDAADTRAIEITGMSMMVPVGMAPEVEGRQVQYADYPSNPFIGAL